MNSKVKAASTIFNDWSALVLQNDFASLTVLPELGGKIASVKSLITGREFLWQDDSRPYRLRHYGDKYGDYDASGFDECFPTIGECIYPEFPWENVTIPDHGELWCTPWLCELRGETIYLHTHGIRFPYHFEKWVMLSPDDGTYTIAYRVTNLAPYDFQYSWSAHPLFAACEGMRILLPGLPQARLVFAIGDRVAGAFLESYTWPHLRAPSGEAIDYSVVGARTVAANDKVYADAEGWCALHDPRTGDFVALSFSPDDIPLIGVCVNHCGWPLDGVRGYWVALEPCTSYPDPLDEAMRYKKNATIPARSSVEWSLTLHIGQANSADEVQRLMSVKQGNSE